MSDKKEREKRREQRLHEETEVERVARRKRLTQLVSGAMFLAIVVVAVVIVIGQSQSERRGFEPRGRRPGKRPAKGIPQEGTRSATRRRRSS